VASDKDGNLVSITQSVGPLMGSKVASMKNGFMLATTMGPYLGTSKAGERAASHISPIIILKDGKPFMALGAAGGARIVPAIVQVISRVIDQGLPLDKALAAARVYQMPEKLLVENHKGIFWKDPTTMSALQKSGNVIEEIKTAAAFGRVHAVMFNNKTGNWIGAADPDWTGTAEGVIK
jgi:gamma-glutamyltranspeptidase/glutathione hydrolase